MPMAFWDYNKISFFFAVLVRKITQAVLAVALKNFLLNHYLNNMWVKVCFPSKYCILNIVSLNCIRIFNNIRITTRKQKCFIWSSFASSSARMTQTDFTGNFYDPSLVHSSYAVGFHQNCANTLDFPASQISWKILIESNPFSLFFCSFG